MVNLTRRSFLRLAGTVPFAPSILESLKFGPRYNINQKGPTLNQTQLPDLSNEFYLKSNLLWLNQSVENYQPQSYWSGMPTYYGSGLWDQVKQNSKYLYAEDSIKDLLVRNGLYCAISPARVSLEYYNFMLNIYKRASTWDSFMSSVIANNSIGMPLRNFSDQVLGNIIYTQSVITGWTLPLLVLDIQSAHHVAQDLFGNIGGIPYGDFTIDMDTPNLSLLHGPDISYQTNRGFVRTEGPNKLINPPDVNIFYFG